MAKHGVIYIINNKIRDGENIFKVGETYDLDKRLTEQNNPSSTYLQEQLWSARADSKIIFTTCLSHDT